MFIETKYFLYKLNIILYIYIYITEVPILISILLRNTLMALIALH